MERDRHVQKNPVCIPLASVVLALISLAPISEAQNSPVVINVDAAHPGAAISPQMFGIFFEDINFGADGGLYPELVKNRSFEFSEPLAAWHEIMVVTERGSTFQGRVARPHRDPLNASNPHYLRIRTYESGYGIYNTGFRGMGVERGRRVPLLRLRAHERTYCDASLARQWGGSRNRQRQAGGIQRKMASTMKRSFARMRPSRKRG